MGIALVGAIALATLTGFLGYVKGIMDARCHSCEYDKQYKRLEDAEETAVEPSCEHPRANLSNDERRYYCAECGTALTREYAESIYADCVLTCEYCSVIFPHGVSDAFARFDFCSRACEAKWSTTKLSGYCYEARHADCKYWLIAGCDCPCHLADTCSRWRKGAIEMMLAEMCDSWIYCWIRDCSHVAGRGARRGEGLMKAGTVIRMSDGRVGTVVYRGLDGEGVRWGSHAIPDDIMKALLQCGSFHEGAAEMAEWYPEAMLREPYPSADIPCVGNDYEILQPGRPADD